MELSQNEVMIVLRNVPGKDEASTNATSITLVAILASAISEAWKVCLSKLNRRILCRG